jgi:hypothetical protein
MQADQVRAVVPDEEHGRPAAIDSFELVKLEHAHVLRKQEIPPEETGPKHKYRHAEAPAKGSPPRTLADLSGSL